MWDKVVKQGTPIKEETSFTSYNKKCVQLIPKFKSECHFASSNIFH